MKKLPGLLSVLLSSALGILLVSTAMGASSQIVNLSGLALVSGSGTNVEIGGFIIQGPSKSVLIEGLGPSLPVSGPLADPYIELYDVNGNLIFQNDNWQDTQASQIIATGIPPSNPLESALIANLAPGHYATILHGSSYGTGTAQLAVYDLHTSAGQLGNASMRAYVGTGANILTAGFISQGQGNREYLIRGLGPELHLPGSLANPYIKIFDVNGNQLYQTDNWKDAQENQISATGLAPTNGLESAMLIILSPGHYTIQLSGVNRVGVGSLEIYAL